MEGVKRLCVDSDILIDYLRGIQVARDFFISQAGSFNFFISVVSIAEIYSGKETKNRSKLRQIEQFLKNFSVLPIAPDIAQLAGQIRRDLNKPFADALVAASVLSNDMILATRNIKHFKDIKNLQIITPY